ncbi:hypothetical protein KCU65_g7532, partial [Aureobasidium melanogenum]
MIDKANEPDKDTLLDLCAYVAFLRNDDDSYKALDRDIPPFNFLNQPDTKAALKRRYGGEVPPQDKRLRYSGPQSLYRSSEDRRQRAFEDQYMMGIDVFDPLNAGMGCGGYELGIDAVSCVSPLKQKMHLEIMSGMSDGQGSIRLSELTDDIGGGITFLLHSALTGEHAGPDEAAEDVFEQVFNYPSMLSGHGKHVIKADAEEFISSVKPREKDRAMCPQDWRENIQVLCTKVDSPDGVLYFLPTGILYGWNDPLSYFSHESIKNVEIHKGAKTKKTFDMTLEVTEPYYHSGKTTKVELKGLSKQDLEAIKSRTNILHAHNAKQKQEARSPIGVETLPRRLQSFIYYMTCQSLTSQQPVHSVNLIFRPAGVAQSVERVALINLIKYNLKVAGSSPAFGYS